MEYTIGQIANMFGLTISTLRYYDKEGLLEKLKGNLQFVNFMKKILKH